MVAKSDFPDLTMWKGSVFIYIPHNIGYNKHSSTLDVWTLT